MKDVLRILLVGDKDVGKSSIISTYTSRHFLDDGVPPIIYDSKLPPDSTANNTFIIIMDSNVSNVSNLLDSNQQMNEEYIMLKEKILLADAIICVYDVTRKDSYDSIITRWLPFIDNALKGDTLKYMMNKSIIIAGNKTDLLVENNIYNPLSDLYTNGSKLNPLSDYSNDHYLYQHEYIQRLTSNLKRYPYIKYHCKCSAKMIDVDNLFYYAENSLVYPPSPVYDSYSCSITKSAQNAYKRIFRVFDVDRDGLLDDHELSKLQAMCYGIEFEHDEIIALKQYIAKCIIPNQNPSNYKQMDLCIKHNKVTFVGFLGLIKKFIEKCHNFENAWILLRACGYEHFDYFDVEDVDSPLATELEINNENMRRLKKVTNSMNHCNHDSIELCYEIPENINEFPTLNQILHINRSYAVHAEHMKSYYIRLYYYLFGHVNANRIINKYGHMHIPSSVKKLYNSQNQYRRGVGKEKLESLKNETDLIGLGFGRDYVVFHSHQGNVTGLGLGAVPNVDADATIKSYDVAQCCHYTHTGLTKGAIQFLYNIAIQSELEHREKTVYPLIEAYIRSKHASYSISGTDGVASPSLDSSVSDMCDDADLNSESENESVSLEVQKYMDEWYAMDGDMILSQGAIELIFMNENDGNDHDASDGSATDYVNMDYLKTISMNGAVKNISPISAKPRPPSTPYKAQYQPVGSSIVDHPWVSPPLFVSQVSNSEVGRDVEAVDAECSTSTYYLLNNYFYRCLFVNTPDVAPETPSVSPVPNANTGENHNQKVNDSILSADKGNGLSKHVSVDEYVERLISTDLSVNSHNTSSHINPTCTSTTTITTSTTATDNGCNGKYMLCTTLNSWLAQWEMLSANEPLLVQGLLYRLGYVSNNETGVEMTIRSINKPLTTYLDQCEDLNGQDCINTSKTKNDLRVKNISVVQNNVDFNQDELFEVPVDMREGGLSAWSTRSENDQCRSHPTNSNPPKNASSYLEEYNRLHGGFLGNNVYSNLCNKNSDISNPTSAMQWLNESFCYYDVFHYMCGTAAYEEHSKSVPLNNDVIHSHISNGNNNTGHSVNNSDITSKISMKNSVSNPSISSVSSTAMPAIIPCNPLESMINSLFYYPSGSVKLVTSAPVERTNNELKMRGNLAAISTNVDKIGFHVDEESTCESALECGLDAQAYLNLQICIFKTKMLSVTKGHITNNTMNELSPCQDLVVVICGDTGVDNGSNNYVFSNPSKYPHICLKDLYPRVYISYRDIRDFLTLNYFVKMNHMVPMFAMNSASISKINNDMIRLSGLNENNNIPIEGNEMVSSAISKGIQQRRSYTWLSSLWRLTGWLSSSSILVCVFYYYKYIILNETHISNAYIGNGESCIDKQPLNLLFNQHVTPWLQGFLDEKFILECNTVFAYVWHDMNVLLALTVRKIKELQCHIQSTSDDLWISVRGNEKVMQLSDILYTAYHNSIKHILKWK